MNIQFIKVLPTPLASLQHSEESIWGNNFSLSKGERILLNASSGKGKSTFTLTSVGLRKDYSGSILYDQKPIDQLSTEEWTKIRQEKISVVFQDLQLFPDLTVQENLCLKNDLKKVFKEEELKSKLEIMGIGDKWNQKCGLLSMGQQQRVAILRALSQPFEWLIMDEPFSHLDAENTQICLDLIKERCDQQNAGFVLTSLGEKHGYSYDRELML